MMSKKMKAIVIAMMVSAMSMSAFAAQPAFDSPEQEAAAYRQERAAQAFEDTYGSHTFSENREYHAVAAFDSPAAEAAAYRQERAAQAFEDMYGGHTFSENREYHAQPAFDLPAAEAAAYASIR